METQKDLRDTDGIYWSELLFGILNVTKTIDCILISWYLVLNIFVVVGAFIVNKTRFTLEQIFTDS